MKSVTYRWRTQADGALGDLVAIFDMTLADVGQVLNVQTSLRIFLQPHRVTQDERNSFTTFPCFDRVGAKLQTWSGKTWSSGHVKPETLRNWYYIMNTALLQYLSGYTLPCRASDGLGRHVTSKCWVDGVEEARLASPNWTYQQHPCLMNCFDACLIALDALHQLLPSPKKKQRLVYKV